MLYSQDSIKVKKNEISVELGGNCYKYSINYQRLLFTKKHVELNAEIGHCYYSNKFQLIPFNFNLVYNRYRFQPEIDFGIIYRTRHITTTIDDFQGPYESVYTICDKNLFFSPKLALNFRINKYLLSKITFSENIGILKFPSSNNYFTTGERYFGFVLGMKF